MAITLTHPKKEDTGIRPLKPSRDMLGVANLIEEAFANELDRSGKMALSDMRWMGRWGVFLSWLDVLSPDVNTNLNGFVWTDRGCIVGNVTVSRNAIGSKHWFISNVAVAKSHQGRGLARQLMDAAVEFVKEMRGHIISLQVRRGNEPAIHLYKSFGFQHISASSFFFMPRARAVTPVAPPAGLILREHRLDSYDAMAAYALARATIPAHIQLEQPLNKNKFRLGAEVSFNNFWRSLVNLGTAKYWVIEDKGNKFVATLNVEPGNWRSKHKLSFMVASDWRGRLENVLISTGLNHLRTCPARPIAFRHPEEHPEGIQALLDYGFKIKRTHICMKLTL